MGVVGAAASLVLIVVVLWDGFETMVLPRRVTRPYRLARLFYQSGWAVWRALARRMAPGRKRETFISVFGPLSLLGLIVTWVLVLMVAFGLLGWSLHIPLHTPEGVPPGFGDYLYLSGVTLLTLGYGDVTPVGGLGRVLAVGEAGIGFGFLAVVIAYLPVLYGAFSQREVTISLLDARAGSPPSAFQLLLRNARAGVHKEDVTPFLAEWEHWAGEVLESQLSFPVLAYYRSQHDNQSWLAGLTTILDTCAIAMASLHGINPYQAQLTFAMARHAVVDICLIFKCPPVPPAEDRLPPDKLAALLASLGEAGLPLHEAGDCGAKLTALRALYEPFVNALARHFLLALPAIVPDRPPVDNWQTSPWTRRAPGIGVLPGGGDDGHFG
jgi:hypothetical protein